MRPILMHGHSRPLTFLKYNKEGDLLFSCAKDVNPTVWYADSGERLGVYKGHEGSVWHLDVDYRTKYLLTASADTTAKGWDVQSGQELFSIKHPSPVRCIAFNSDATKFITVTDASMGQKKVILRVFKFDPENQSEEPEAQFEVSQGKTKTHIAYYGPLDDKIFTASEDGFVRVWDAETFDEIDAIEHPDKVTNFAFNRDQTLFVTVCGDKTVRLFDTKSHKQLKKYSVTHPVNAATIAPEAPHIALAGGQEAMKVTTTDMKQGNFETKFFHMVFEEELGMCKGHFGPVNAVVFSPDGKSFATGGEDGYVRLQHFDASYFEQTEKMEKELEQLVQIIKEEQGDEEENTKADK